MNKKLKILEVCTSPSWGGMEMRVLKTAKELKALNHEVEVLCAPDSNLCENLTAEKLPLKALPFKGGIHLNLIMKLRKYIKEKQFDVIHLQYSKDLRFVIPAIEGIKPKIPVVLTKRLGSYVSKKDFIHKYLFSRLELVTAISNVIKQNVIDTCPISAEKVCVLYNGIDSDIYQQALSERNKIRSEFNTTNKTVVGIIGRISPGKGHEEFINAINLINQQNISNVEFWIIGNASYGEDDYADKILDELKAVNKNNNVKLLGFRKDIPEVLAGIDILTVPSHAEAFGNVAIEGMAAGKPVVASGSDGLLDTIEDNISGLFVQPKDSIQLCNAILKLVDDPQLCKSMGEAGLKRAKEIFDADKQNKKLVEIFTELVEK